MEENVNPAMAGNGTSDPSTDLDNPANLDFVDPDDEQDTREGADAQGTEGETAETSEDEGQEAENPQDDDEAAEAEAETDADEESDDAEDKEAPDNVYVTMKDGERVSIDELKSGYMRDADYRRKTMETASERKSVAELQNRLNTTVEAFANFLSQQVPNPPDIALATTDPGRYVQEKALYDSALSQIQAVIDLGSQARNVGQAVDRDQRLKTLREEDAKLAQAFPQTTNPEGRKKFFDQAYAGAEALGISRDELNSLTDHRAYLLAHYAKLGLAAESAGKKAKAKVEKAPPMAPQKRAKGASEGNQRKNREAMKRLAQTGSIHDAMGIDFE
jgi:hypothetical protein